MAIHLNKYRVDVCVGNLLQTRSDDLYVGLRADALLPNKESPENGHPDKEKTNNGLKITMIRRTPEAKAAGEEIEFQLVDHLIKLHGLYMEGKLR